MSRVYQEHGKVKIYRCSIGFETKLRNFAFVCSPACAKTSEKVSARKTSSAQIEQKWMELKWRAGEPVLFHKDVMPFSFLFLIVITMGRWDFHSPPIGKAI